MRRTVQILACLLLSLGWQPVATWAQEPVLDEANAFVTRWQGEAGEPIKVPLYGSYAYRWEKADGTEMKRGVATVANGGLLELPVPETGEYVLKAGPEGVRRIEFGKWDGDWYGGIRGTPEALLRVEQWGSVAWKSFGGAFKVCKNMNIAEGAGKPDLSGVQSMHSAFLGCSSFNQPLEKWEVSNVTSMRRMFLYCYAFNQPLGAWDVSTVTNMTEMFYGCTSFNQPLEKWDVSKVENMWEMFYDCRAFNQPLGAWDVSRVTDMGRMFSGCSSFNQPLANWDVSRVEDMGWMFAFCSSFNQPLEQWDVSKVTNMEEMFAGSGSSFNQPLGGWTLSALARDEKRDHDLGLRGRKLDAENYSSTLVAWAAKRDQLRAGVRVAAYGLKYNAAGKSARQQLIDDKAWEFAGDGEAPVALTSIAMSPTTARLAIGGTQTLTVSYAPEDAANKAVTWSSSNESVATVSEEGVVTGKGKGTAMITVTSADGGHTASCAVEVTAPVALTGITVTPANARLAVGDTQTLTVGYTPVDATNRAVTWSSSDERVATVSEEGLVMGKGEGTAKITVTSVDGGHTATCAVTVVAPVPLTGIAVSPTRARIAIGGTQALAVRYTPADATNKAVTWSSSDEDVATVSDEGQVTGKGKGSATITVKADDGGHTATCAVTVVVPVALTGITVMPTSAQLKVGETQQLALGYTPADATNRRVTWHSSDKGVATVDVQGKVTGVKVGTATITATSADGGHTATCSVTVVADEKPSGVESVALAGVTVSPNPFGDHLTVRGAEGVLRYSLVSATGVVVLEGAHDGASELRLEAGRLAAGMYWLRLEATDGERVVQVVKR